MSDDILDQYRQIKLFNESLDSIKYLKNYLRYNFSGSKARDFINLFNQSNEETRIPIDVGIFQISNENYFTAIVKEGEEYTIEFGIFYPDLVQEKLIRELVKSDPEKRAIQDIKIEKLKASIDPKYYSTIMYGTNDNQIIPVMSVVSSYVRDKLSEYNLDKLVIYTDFQRARLYMKVINKVLTENIHGSPMYIAELLEIPNYSIKVIKKNESKYVRLHKIIISKSDRVKEYLNKVKEDDIVIKVKELEGGNK